MCLLLSAAMVFAQDSDIDPGLSDDATLDRISEEPSLEERPDPLESVPEAMPSEPVAGEAEASDQETAATQDTTQEDDTDAASEDTPQSTEIVESPENSPVAIASQREEELPPVSLRGSKVFGKKRVNIAYNRPTFTANQKLREKLYGKDSEHISATGDWFPLDWWVNPGMAFRIGGYSASGKAALGSPTSQDIENGNFEVDDSSKTTLLFIPMMAAAKIEMTPFRKKWIVLEGWFGYEYGWWQETRDTSSSTTAASSSAGNDSVYTSKGNKSAVVFGGAVNLLLNWLDPRSVRSMVDTMGISDVYISPFFEVVKSTQTTGLQFSRNTIGLGFTFESAK
jgi:hypothetical protein